MFFPIERAKEVLQAWQELTTTLPDEMTSVGRVLSFPPFDEIPEIVRGQSFAIVEGIYTGPEAEGAELMRPIRELGPLMDTFATVPPVGLAELHMDPRDPMPYVSGHALLSDLPATAIDAVIDSAEIGPGSAVAMLEFRHTGGALSRSAEHHGAMATMAGNYAMFGGGAVMTPEMGVAVQAQMALVTGAVAPYDAGRYLNFVEEPTDASVAFPAESYARLQRVRAEYDPDGRFQANHQI
jgi:hypothetical protein